MKQSLIACHTCDLLHRVRPLPVRSAARCRRCGTRLYSHSPQPVERTLASALTGLVLIVIANVYPFLSLQSQGTILETNLITGAIILSEQSMAGLALVVLLTSMLVPCILLGPWFMCYGQCDAATGRRPPGGCSGWPWRFGRGA